MRNEALRLNPRRELADQVLARVAAEAFWLPLAVGLAYYVGCLAGFALRFPGNGISFFWPPTAMLTAALLLAAQRHWPGFLLGSLAAHGIAHSADGIRVSAWLVLFVGNASQAVLAAAIVRRFNGGTDIFTGWRRIVTFVLAGRVLYSPVASGRTPFVS
jgi:integral membrane sensor domain MASE1